jgi:hypothetical protein
MLALWRKCREFYDECHPKIRGVAIEADFYLPDSLDL